MCANPQSNQLNTIAVRASYILPISSDFLGENQEKPGGGWSISLRKNLHRNQSVFSSFGVDPLNWQSFSEIGGMARSTTAGVLVDTLLSHYLAVLKRSIRT